MRKCGEQMAHFCTNRGHTPSSHPGKRKEIMFMTATLPQDFIVRPPTKGDAESIAGLMNICERAEYTPPEDYIPDYTATDLRGDWQASGFDLVTDAWVVIAPGEQIAGYLDVQVGYTDVQRTTVLVRINANSCVHPIYRGQGIGTHLLRLAQARAYQLVPTGDLVLNAWISHTSDATRRLFEQEDFTSSNHSVFRMEIKMSDEPPAPVWPEGITVRTFIPGQDDRAVFETIEEAFEAPFEHWDEIYTYREDFDPTMWHLALAGDKVVGALLCVPVPAMGWVDMLGVRRPWRKKGLGMALLLQAFRDLYRRGLRQIALSVGAQNATGAQKLYERRNARCQPGRRLPQATAFGRKLASTWQRERNPTLLLPGSPVYVFVRKG